MKKADIILAAVIIAISAALFGVRMFTRTEGGAAVVTVDGIKTAEYPLDADLEEDIVTPGGVNHLVIHAGAASVTDADCPDQLCVHQADIRYNGETIVCLPHKLVVRIESAEAPELDDVVK